MRVLPCLRKDTITITGQKPIEELDLGFAISAAAIDADDTFGKIKESLRVIIDIYGTGNIRYGIILFGSSSVIAKAFGERYEDDDALKSAILSFQRPSGEPNLKQALRKAKMMFDASTTRPSAKKASFHVSF